MAVRSFPSPVKPRRSPRRTGQLVRVIVFLVILYLPAVGMIAQPHKQRIYGAWQEGENRPFPRLAWRPSSILAFPKEFGEYFQYNFGFRRNLIRWHTKLVGKTLGKNPSSNVVEGKEGWLFLGENGTIEDYRGMLPFTPQQLERWREGLERRRAWLARQGIHYLFVLCPDKHSIYAEYMPDRINRVRTQSRLDQFMEYMKKHSRVEILDLRPALLESKKQHLCYQPRDTHWNSIGAFVGYQQTAQRLRTWYPDIRVLDMSDCEVCQQENPLTDLVRLQGKENVKTVMDGIRPIGGFRAELQQDPNDCDNRFFELTRSARYGAPIGRLLMVHDSFANLLIPFLAEHFRDALYIWGKDDRFLPQTVLDYKPDVVIEEIVERRLCEKELSLLEVPVPPERTVPSSTSDSERLP
jgi:alginate O-acetyltransferase complex protein AlgJ